MSRLMIFIATELPLSAWIFLLLQGAVVMAICWSLQGAWKSEHKKALAVVVIGLNLVVAVFPVYLEHVLGTRQLEFQQLLKIASRYDTDEVLLSILALLVAIAWRRSSRNMASLLALLMAFFESVLRLYVSVMSA